MTLKSNRKKFLQQLAAGSAWAALGLGGKIWGESVSPLADLKGKLLASSSDEDFWTSVRKQYDLPANIYLNTGTLGLMPRSVIAEINARMLSLSQGRYAIDESPRQAVARLFHVGPESIALTHNTTEGINIVAQGLKLKRGDEVIITDHEHVGNALPWLNRARLTGIKLRVLSPGSTATETLDRLSALITRRTRAFALPHITCTVGTVLPIKEISKLASERGIFSFFDGAHGPGMLFPDLQDIGCDAYASCGHKWLGGPAGTGMLYLKPELLSKVEAIMVGAYSDTGWELNAQNQTMSPLVDTAHRYDYGTQNAALSMGLKSAIEFNVSIGVDKIKERIHSLAGYLQSKLQERSYIEMLTPTEEQSRSAIIGFRVRGRNIQQIEQTSLPKEFRIRLVAESGLQSVRISTHIHNNHEDLDRLLDGLDRLVRI